MQHVKKVECVVIPVTQRITTTHTVLVIVNTSESHAHLQLPAQPIR